MTEGLTKEYKKYALKKPMGEVDEEKKRWIGVKQSRTAGHSPNKATVRLVSL